MIKLFVTIVFFLSCVTCYAQTERFKYEDSTLLMESQQGGNIDTAAQETVDESAENDILSDTTLYISAIELSPDSVLKWKTDKRFNYILTLDSLLKNKQQKELLEYKKRNNNNSVSFLQRLLSSRGTKIFFWMVAIAFVIFIIYRLFFVNGIFRREKFLKPSITETAVLEVAPKTVAEYDKLIHQSYRLGDYRMAVRYLFLKNLVMLSGKELIYLSADKTNYQYVQEIDDTYKHDFAALVLNYEYVWYGNFPLTADAFTGIEKKFSAFYHKISG